MQAIEAIAFCYVLYLKVPIDNDVIYLFVYLFFINF